MTPEQEQRLRAIGEADQRAALEEGNDIYLDYLRGAQDEELADWAHIMEQENGAEHIIRLGGMSYMPLTVLDFSAQEDYEIVTDAPIVRLLFANVRDLTQGL